MNEMLFLSGDSRRLTRKLADRVARLVLLLVASWSVGCDMAPAPVPLSAAVARQEPVVRVTGRPLVNEKAIAASLDIPIARLDGSRFSLRDFQGRVVVVDFWATYCPPCVKQAPQLAELSRRYRDQGLEVIGLTSDEKSDQAKVEDFMQRVGINYNIGYAGNWVSRSFLYGTEDETGAPPIPQLFILSRKGKVVEHLIGDSPRHGIDYLEEVVRRELAAD